MNETTNLYDLSNSAIQLTRQIEDAAAGLDSDDPTTVAAAVAALEALLAAENTTEAAIAAKANSYCWVIAKLSALADARREQAQRLADLADQNSAKAQTMLDRLAHALSRAFPEKTRWELEHFNLLSCKSISTEVSCLAEELPAEFQRVTTKVAADKTLLRRAIEAGREIHGVTLKQSRSWRIK